jgi:hypothetical protein
MGWQDAPVVENGWLAAPLVEGFSQPDEAEMIAGNPAVRFALGAASPALGVAQLGAEAVGATGVTEHLQRLEQMKKRGMTPAAELKRLQEARDILSRMPGYEAQIARIDEQIMSLGDASADPRKAGVDVAGFAGTMLSPAVLGAMKLPVAQSLTGKALTGAGIGAGFGAVSPVTDGDDFLGTKSVQMGTGAALGGVMAPLAQGVVRGTQAIKGALTPNPVRIATKAAGDKLDDVVDAILRTDSKVPRVSLNAGQRAVPAASPEFSALQTHVAQKAPSIYSKIPSEIGQSGLGAQQQSAREAALRTVAGTPDDLAAAIAARKAASDEAYKEAFSTFVKRDKELRELWKNPYFKDEVGEAFKIFKAKRQVLQSQGLPAPRLTKDLTAFLHSVKEGLDARLQSLTKPDAPAISNAAKSSIIDAQKQLVGWLGDKNPAYEAARLQHASMSQPINQMRLGQELEQSLRSPLTDLERPAQFSNTLQKFGKQISKATGKPRIEALTSQQRNTLGAIESDLQRDAALAQLSSEGAKSMAERTGAVVYPPTGFFQPMVSASRSWLNKISDKITEKGMRELAVMMAENPQGLAMAMRDLSPAKQKAIQEQIQILTRMGIVGSTELTNDGIGVLSPQRGALSQ